MAKSKVTPAPPGPQEAQAPRTVPLSDITITWHRQPFYSGESGKIPCVITGKQLGVLLEWLSHTKHPTEKDGPGLLHYFGDPDFISMQLEGLGHIAQKLADMEDQEEARAMFWSLGHVVGGLAGQLAAGVESKEGRSTAKATVTIGALAREAT
jgi:hypothetical protein